MKLVFEMAQPSGPLGGVSFEITARVKLTPKEQELIRHYRLQNEVLLSKKLVTLWGQPSEKEIALRVKQLVDGDTFRCRDFAEVLAYQQAVVDASSNLLTYLRLAREFEGTVEVDIGTIETADEAEARRAAGDIEDFILADPDDEALMARLGIAFDGESYLYGQYKYKRLEDAVAYARVQFGE